MSARLLSAGADSEPSSGFAVRGVSNGLCVVTRGYMAATVCLGAFRNAPLVERLSVTRCIATSYVRRASGYNVIRCEAFACPIRCPDPAAARADRYDWLCGALIALAAVVRMPLLELPGHVIDIALFKQWGLIAVEHGLFRVYELTGINHPPLSALLWWCIAHLAHLINLALGFLDPGLATDLDSLAYSVAYTVLVKGPACIADLLIGVLVYRWARQIAGPRWAVAAAAMILLHPALIYISAWWGTGRLHPGFRPAGLPFGRRAVIRCAAVQFSMP